MTPSGAGDVVLAVPGGRSCSAGSALCTPARQSLSHDLSATIRDGTASSHRPGQTSPPGRVRDLRAEYHGSADYLIFFRIPLEGDGALKYHILVGGCGPGFHRRITVRGWSRYFSRVVAAGSDGRTRAFGVEGVNRNGTGPCVEVMTVLPPKADLVAHSPSVNDNSLSPGESFTLSVSVANDGAGNAAWRPLLSYYRSDDTRITQTDTEVGDERTDEEKEIGAVFAGQTRRHSISLTAPSAGTYYYGACVSGNSSEESDSTNNCSGSVAVVVSNLAGQPGSGAATSHRMHGSRRARVGLMGVLANADPRVRRGGYRRRPPRPAPRSGTRSRAQDRRCCTSSVVDGGGVFRSATNGRQYELTATRGTNVALEAPLGDVVRVAPS